MDPRVLSVAVAIIAPVPPFGTPTRIGLSITLPALLPSGASASVGVGNPATRFLVYPTGTTSVALALDSTAPIVVGASSIMLTGYAYRWRYGDSLASISGATSASYTPVTADIGHTLQRGVIASNATGASSEVWSATTTAVAVAGSTKIGGDLTPTSMTYGTGGSGFGQERTGGYLAAAADGDTISASNTWTVEGVISIAAIPSTVRVCFGQASKVWVGCSATDGRLVVNVQWPNYIGGTGNNGGGTNPVIADGLRHHVKVSCAAGAISVFLDGALVISAGGATNNTAGGRWNIGTFLSSNTYVWSGTVDEVAVWPVARHSAAFAKPTGPYVGNEGMTSLWHLDGSASAAVV